MARPTPDGARVELLSPHRSHLKPPSIGCGLFEEVVRSYGCSRSCHFMNCEHARWLSCPMDMFRVNSCRT